MAAGLASTASDPEDTQNRLPADGDFPDEPPLQIQGRWLRRAGQNIWRCVSVHMNNCHANKRREHARITFADLIGLALRDRADFVSGDFNQAGGYLEECVYHAVKFYEFENDLPPGTVQWALPGPECEIRTVIFNWPVEGGQYHMWYREQRTFRDFSVQGFGLRATDTDAHVPQFPLVTKSKEEGTAGAAYRSIFHSRSAQGKAHGKERKNRSRFAKREAAKAERMATAEASKAAPHSSKVPTPAASSGGPMPKTAEPEAPHKSKGKSKGFYSWLSTKGNLTRA